VQAVCRSGVWALFARKRAYCGWGFDRAVGACERGGAQGECAAFMAKPVSGSTAGRAKGGARRDPSCGLRRGTRDAPGLKNRGLMDEFGEFAAGDAEGEVGELAEGEPADGAFGGAADATAGGFCFVALERNAVAGDAMLERGE
jgi:hypothetical protein